MKNSVTQLLMCVIVLLMLVTHGRAEQPAFQIITADFPPYDYEEDGQMKGLSTEFVQAILEDLGMEADITSYPWKRAYIMATKEKNVLIYTLARVPAREGKFHFIGEVVPRIAYFFKLAKRTDIQVDSIEHLK